MIDHFGEFKPKGKNNKQSKKEAKKDKKQDKKAKQLEKELEPEIIEVANLEVFNASFLKSK